MEHCLNTDLRYKLRSTKLADRMSGAKILTAQCRYVSRSVWTTSLIAVTWLLKVFSNTFENKF